MPARERERLLLALLKLRSKPNRGKQRTGRIKWPDVEARAKRILGDRVLPNLVLLERRDEAV
jgi:hypothetical protein